MSAKPIRPFVLLSIVLGTVSCTEAAAPKALPTAKGELKEKTALPRSLEPVAMTATTPQNLRTVLSGSMPKEETQPPTRERAEETATKEPTSDTASMEEEVDYERPLSPEEVQIDRFVLATDVSAREPVGETDVFTTDTKKIFAFVQLANAEGAPYSFRVHWEPVEGPASPYGVALKVETAPRYRTWSWTAIRREPGHYRAVLRTLDGEEIASREFVIEPGMDELAAEE